MPRNAITYSIITSTLTIALLAATARNTLAQGAAASATQLATIANDMRGAASAFQSGITAKQRLSKETIRRIYDIAKASAEAGDELQKWSDQLSPHARSAWVKCTWGSMPGFLGELKITIEFDPFGGGTKAPEVSYPDMAGNARNEAAILQRDAGCFNVALTAGRQEAAEAARAEQQQQAEERRAEIERQNTERRQVEEQARAERAQADAQQTKLRQQLQRDLAARSAARQAYADTVQAFSDRTTEQITSFASHVFDTDDPSAFKGTTWHMALDLGLSMQSFPLYENTSGSNVRSFSSAGSSTSAGPLGGIEFWPVYGPNIGIGGFGSFMYGAFASTQGTSSASANSMLYGGRAYLGVPTFAMVGEYAFADRTGSTSTDLASFGYNTTTTGDATYSATRYGGGVRFGSVQGNHLQLLYLLDRPSIGTGVATVNTYEARIGAGPLALVAEYSPNYPVAGSAKYAVDSGEKSSGSLYSVGVQFAMRFWGDPYVKPAVRRGMLDGM